MFNLETFRLIRKTRKRFISLVLIVMIGAGFMMGMTSNPIILRQSVDAEYDKRKLFDLMIYSQYGFCLEDYQKISSIDAVENVFPSKTIDCRAVSSTEEELVIRVTELMKNVNKYVLLEGRMPQASNECLMLASNEMHQIGIGDTLTLDYGKNDINDYLSENVYKIVGTVDSIDYFSKVQGASNYNNENLQSVIFVPNANFVFDYYTAMYLTVKGADQYMSYTDEYDNYIADKRIEIETAAYEQQNYLKDKLIKEAEEELESKTEMFNELKEKGQQQLDEAKAQLDEANIMIISYETQLASMDAMVKALEAAVKADKPIYDSIYSNTAKAEDYANYIMEEFGIDVGHYGTSAMDYTRNAYYEALGKYNSLKGQLNSAKAQYEAGLKEYAEGLASYNSQIEEGELQLKLARQRLEELPGAKWMILDRDYQYSTVMYKGTIRQMRQIGIYLPIMFFLVAALVCLTTMKRLVDEQRGQIGAYVALGFSNRQIIMKYVTYALLASLSGGIIGIAVGQQIFPTVVYNTWKMMYRLPDIILSYPIGSILLSILSFSILMGSVTAYVVKEEISEVPAALMRPKAPKKGKEVLIEKIGFIWNRLSFTSKITARNIFRYKSRFLMTVIGIAGCTGLLVLGFGIKDSVSGVLGNQYGRIFKFNYQVFLNSSEHLESNMEILKDNLDNEIVNSYMSYNPTVYFDDGEDAATCMVLDPRDETILFDLHKTDRRTPIRLTNDGVIVSQKFAKNHNIKAGDYITFESSNGYKASAKVSEICEMYFSHYIFISKALYETTFEETPVNNIIAVKTNDTDTLIKDCEKLEDFQSAVDFSSMINTIDNLVSALNVIILVIILVAGSLAFVVLMNLTQVNISERVREIATLKVLGFNSHEINMYIFKEILLLSFIGCIVGLPLGVVEHHIIMNEISMEMIQFGMNIDPPAYIYAVAITMLFTVIVLFFMRKPLKEVDMVESLKSVE